MKIKCPGQDTRYWTIKDIYEVACPKCGNPEEFFKDDTIRSCSKCNNQIKNPRIYQGCATYCKHADDCLS